ncbi:MAG: N-acetyltransferase [Sedimentisphaerales bacterium]|nr:N-acetyltransferase [Sedimentisphaerales bacterium]
MIRNARLEDVPTLRNLISSHAERGLMLFRSQANLYESIRDFKVCELDGKVRGCCALAIVWSDLAEIRSLAVAADYQGRGIGAELVQAALAEARSLGVARVFTLTLESGFFEKQGFAEVERDALPMKVWSDCVNCPKQENCDETALVCDLA